MPSPFAPSLCLGTSPSAGNGDQGRGSIALFRITSVPSQKDVNSSHVPLKHSGRLRQPYFYFRSICAGRSVPLSVAAIKAGLAGLVPNHTPCYVEKHMTLQLQSLLIIYSVCSGSIGFAAGTPPRSDSHAEILANMEPWRQENLFVHQNVTAILTAVLATGGNLLWINHRTALRSLGFLCKISCPTWPRNWLWVGACRLQCGQTMFFATSSPGLLPLASQCDHASTDE